MASLSTLQELLSLVIFLCLLRKITNNERRACEKKRTKRRKRQRNDICELHFFVSSLWFLCLSHAFEITAYHWGFIWEKALLASFFLILKWYAVAQAWPGQGWKRRREYISSQAQERETKRRNLFVAFSFGGPWEENKYILLRPPHRQISFC